VKSKVVNSLGVIMLASLIAGMVGGAASAEAPLPPQERLRVATTPSLYDTGLWGYLEHMFYEKYNV